MYLSIFLGCLVAVFIASSGFSAGAKERPTISDAERAVAALNLQNTYSKHTYYHTIGNNYEEMADIWVKEDGPYAKTTTWTSAMDICEVLPLIKAHYCT